MPLIIAPPCAGKTHFVKQTNDVTVVDGDDIIAELVGWPDGEWWRHKKLRDRTNELNAQVIAQYLLDHPDHIVLYHGDCFDLAHHVGENDIIVAVPSGRELMMNLAERKKGHKRGPTDWFQIQRAARDVIKFASRFLIPAFGSIAEAVGAARVLVNKRKGIHDN